MEQLIMALLGNRNKGQQTPQPTTDIVGYKDVAQPAAPDGGVMNWMSSRVGHGMPAANNLADYLGKLF